MRVFKIARLATRERVVIGLLRGADPAADAIDARLAFDRLRSVARMAGFCLASPGTGFVTRDELCLLGILASLQRRNPDVAIRVHPGLRVAAVPCAVWLGTLNYHLPLATLKRLETLSEHCRSPSVEVLPVPAKAAEAVPTRALAPGGLQADALRYVRARGRTSTHELAGVGVSRQIVSLMCKRGLLVRAGFGLYGAVPETTMRG